MNRITFLLLLLGFGSALVIYLTAKPEPIDPLRGDPRGNKKYLHEMQVIGGKANLLADEFQDWFAEQWQGATLARTVVVLTVGVSLAFRFVATHPDSAAAPVEEKIPPPGPSG